MAAVAATVPWRVNATANTKKIKNNSTFDVLLFFLLKTIKYLVNGIDNSVVKVYNILR